ncbi:MAG: ABC transporter ATP-binding protein [Calditrichaeota bacterium]|nr:ABC transporter ATP-binding protein [Calditrichota bacterium]
MHHLIVDNVAKTYGETRALKGVSLAVEKGELFGLIGPDGAGKTTLLRSICTLLVPDSGSITVAGLDISRDVPAIRAILGYMPQRFSLYQDLSVAQNLRFFADLFQVPKHERPERLARLYHFSRLEPFKSRLAGNLSGGMKQKLALSCALIHTPEILVLDEPTFGVDPVSRQEFWEILHQIRAGGTTIVVSTAYMDEADQCDRIALFFEGEIAAMGSPAAVKGAFPYRVYRLSGTALQDLKTFLEGQPEVRGIQLFGDALHVSFSEKPSPETWREWARRGGFPGLRWEEISPSIEDVFLAHMAGETA